MTDKRRALAAGCAGTVVGGILGCFLGGIIAQTCGLQPTGSLLFFALDLLFYVCVGGGGIIGAIAGREIGTALANLSKGKGTEGTPSPEPPGEE